MGESCTFDVWKPDLSLDVKNVLLNEKTADKIWEEANAKLATVEFSTRGILTQMNIKTVGTNDDPIDSLEYHKQIALDT